MAGPVARMRAPVCRAYGAPDVVKLEDDFPAPTLGPGQARVQVRAAAVNFPDVLIVANEYQMSAPLPFVPGSEFAGVVTEVHDDVSTVAVGDSVSGTCFVGAFAEQVVVASSALTAIPVGVDERVAAAFGVAHRTAYHVLRSVAACSQVNSSSSWVRGAGSAWRRCSSAWSSERP